MVILLMIARLENGPRFKKFPFGAGKRRAADGFMSMCLAIGWIGGMSFRMFDGSTERHDFFGPLNGPTAI